MVFQGWALFDFYGYQGLHGAFVIVIGVVLSIHMLSSDDVSIRVVYLLVGWPCLVVRTYVMEKFRVICGCVVGLIFVVVLLFCCRDTEVSETKQENYIFFVSCGFRCRFALGSILSVAFRMSLVFHLQNDLMLVVLLGMLPISGLA